MTARMVIPVSREVNLVGRRELLATVLGSPEGTGRVTLRLEPENGSPDRTVVERTMTSLEALELAAAMLAVRDAEHGRMMVSLG